MKWPGLLLCGALVLVGMIGLVVYLSGTAASSDAATVNCILKEEPQDAKDVIATREKAQDKDDVVVVGRIGGRENPWVKGTAAFSIVDLSLKPCNEREGDTCETPWDYCCES